MTDKKWIALDISTTSTGYSVYEARNHRAYLLRHGHLDGVGKRAVDRFPGLVEKISALIQKENPGEVVIEATFYRLSFKSIEYLLKIQGCIEALCNVKKIKFGSITTTDWRGMVGFPTNFKKTDSKTYKNLSLTLAGRIAREIIESDDEADAICIGLAHYIKEGRKCRCKQ